VRFEAERKRLEAKQPTSDFDKAAEDTKKIEKPKRPRQAQSEVDNPSKKTQRRKKRTDA
jgi:hypothetical protein